MQKIYESLNLLNDFVNKIKGPNFCSESLHYNFKYDEKINYGEIIISLLEEYESIKILYFENKITAEIMTGEIGNFYLEWDDKFLAPKDNPIDFVKDIKEHIPIFAKALGHDILESD